MVKFHFRFQKMDPMTLYAAPVSFLVTWAATRFLLTSELGRRISDIPNERSLHKNPVPRVGGIALLAGTATGWLFLVKEWHWWILLPLFILFTLSILDDIYDLPVRIRLGAHLLAAFLMAWGAGSGPWLPFFAIAAVWMLNLYNFMDGSDGLAGGMALFGFSAYGIAAFLHGDHGFAAMNFCLAASALGFLIFNFHPAKLFMGDAGSVPLGFLAASFGVSGWKEEIWPLWFPLLVFSPFVVDATATLGKRVARREKFWQAHREHYYQRLVRMGLGHRNTALCEYLLMLLAGGSALAALEFGRGLEVLILWIFAYFLLMIGIDAAWRKEKSC